MLNGVGDLFDIIPACDTLKRTDWMSLNQAEAENLHQKSGHCSALIKVTGNMSDLFLAHSSWYTYSNMNRIFKHYNLQFKDESTKSRKLSNVESNPVRTGGFRDPRPGGDRSRTCLLASVSTPLAN